MNYSTYDDNENVTNAPLNLSLNGNGTYVLLKFTFAPIYAIYLICGNCTKLIYPLT